MGDIEAMFYQVHVPKENSDCLRFFWWLEKNLHKEANVYRNHVRLFNVAPSPGSHTAEEISEEYKAAVSDKETFLGR